MAAPTKTERPVNASYFDISYCIDEQSQDTACKAQSLRTLAMIHGMPSLPKADEKKREEFAKKYGLDKAQLSQITAFPLNFRDAVDPKELKSKPGEDPTQAIYRAVQKKGQQIAERYRIFAPRAQFETMKGLEGYNRADSMDRDGNGQRDTNAKDATAFDGIVERSEYNAVGAQHSYNLLALNWLMREIKTEEESDGTVSALPQKGAYYYCSSVTHELPICRVDNAADFYLIAGGTGFYYPSLSEAELAFARQFNYPADQTQKIYDFVNIKDKDYPIDYTGMGLGLKNKQDVLKALDEIIVVVDRLEAGGKESPLGDDLRLTRSVYEKADKDGDGKISKKEFKEAAPHAQDLKGNPSAKEKGRIRLLILGGILAKGPAYIQQQIEMLKPPVPSETKPATQPTAAEKPKETIHFWQKPHWGLWGNLKMWGN